MENRFPFTPFPNGIFSVAFSHELRLKQVLSIIFMGRSLALFRTEKNEIGALESYCPHLGANLGYGTVIKDTLQCPFHGICFKKDGSSSTKNRCGGSFQAESWSAFEQYGLIFLVHNPLKTKLNIHFPSWNLDEWSKPVEYCFKIESHPQEIFENSVDQLHFYLVHKYLSAKMTKPFTVNDTEFTIDFRLERREGVFGLIERKKIEMHLNIHAYGLGLSKVEVWIPNYNLNIKQIVFPTPIDGEWIHIRTMTSVKIPKKLPFIPKWIIPYFIRRIITNILGRVASKGFLKDFIPDIKIWENKKYISNPHYLHNDGDFEKYRQWAKQFYRLESDVLN